MEKLPMEERKEQPEEPVAITAFQASDAVADLTSCLCPGPSDHEPHSKRVVGSFPPLWLLKDEALEINL